jgi:hypothetical protein
VLTEVLLTVVARIVTPGQRQLPFRRRVRPVDAPEDALGQPPLPEPAGGVGTRR